MSQTVHPTRPRGPAAASQNAPAPAPAPAPASVPGEEPAVSFGEALEWLWRFFISRRTGLVLILLLGTASGVGTLLEQAPAEVRADPAAYATWVDSVRSRYGGWTGTLSALGLFRVFSAPWFIGLLVLLATSIIACSAHRTPVLLRRARHPRVRMNDGFFDRAALSDDAGTPAPVPEALAAVAGVLRRRHFRTVTETGGGTSVYADRFRWAPLGSIAAHLGFVVILLGAFLSATTGFKDPQVIVPVGTRVQVGHGTGLSVQALSFTDDYYDNGSPKDYASDLVVYRGGASVARQTVRVNQPLGYGGVSFYQSFFGTAAQLQVKDAAGKAVADEAVALSWRTDDGKHVVGRLALEAAGLTVFVVAPASGEVDPAIQAGQVQVEVYRAGADTPQATQVISQGTPASVAGQTFTFVREQRFTGLIVARDPGALWVWIGALLLVGGIFSVFFFPHRRIWVQVTATADGSRIRCASHLRHDAAFEPQFRALMADVRAAAQAASPKK